MTTKEHFCEQDKKQTTAAPILGTIPTKNGSIKAVLLKDDEYPAISLVYSADGNGEPGAVMEYDREKDQVLMRIYDREHPDDEPVKTLYLN